MVRMGVAGTRCGWDEQGVATAVNRCAKGGQLSLCGWRFMSAGGGRPSGHEGGLRGRGGHHPQGANHAAGIQYHTVWNALQPLTTWCGLRSSSQGLLTDVSAVHVGQLGLSRPTDLAGHRCREAGLGHRGAVVAYRKGLEGGGNGTIRLGMGWILHGMQDSTP